MTRPTRNRHLFRGRRPWQRHRRAWGIFILILVLVLILKTGGEEDDEDENEQDDGSPRWRRQGATLRARRHCCNIQLVTAECARPRAQQRPQTTRVWKLQAASCPAGIAAAGDGRAPRIDYDHDDEDEQDDDTAGLGGIFILVLVLVLILKTGGEEDDEDENEQDDGSPRRRR